MQASTDIPPSLLLWSAGTLNILVLAGVGVIYRTLRDHGDRLLTLSVVLTGKDGNNGLSSDVKQLRRRSHRFGNVINYCVNGIYRLEERVDLDHLPLPVDSAE